MNSHTQKTLYVGVFVFIFLIVFSVSSIFMERAAKVESTKQLVKELSKTEGTGEDSWGNEIKVNVEKTATGTKTVAISAGPDGKFDTFDDIKSARHNVDTSQVGKTVGEEATKLGSGLIKGIGKAIKDEFFDKKDE